MIQTIVSRAVARNVPAVLWPVVIVRHIWTSAVVSEESIAFNLRLLTVLTAVFGVPDLLQGVILLAHSTGSSHLYAAYVTLLALLELGGALLLFRRLPWGRWLILAAACGFYPAAALGLAIFERGLISAVVVAVSAPAEAWVIWFLSHQRVRRRIDAW